MTRVVTITADDFGLSRGITDTILETVDQGPVRRVSVLANGEATEYALEEYKKRPNLDVVVHLNLTEGKALSAPKDISHLVYTDGRFCHSVGGLWLSYVFATKYTREEMRAEVQREARAQIDCIQKFIGTDTIAINSHQHVHLLPFIADTLVTMPEVASLRRVNEPAYMAGMCSLPHLFVRPIIRFLSHRVSVTAKAGNDWFIGFAYAGHMTIDRMRQGLSRVPNGNVEILFHPGNALAEELKNWSASFSDLNWHTSPHRESELNTLLDPHFDEALNEPYSIAMVTLGRTVRFVIAGGTAAAVHLTILYLLTEYAGLWYLYAAMIGWCFGFLTSFTLQKFWTFDDACITSVGHQASQFFLLQISNAFLNIVGMFVLVSIWHVWYLLAQVVLALILGIETYLVSRRFIFRAN